MNRFHYFVFVRHRRNWGQLLRFGVVGGSGVGVNMLVVILLKRVGPEYHGAIFGLGLADFHVRWYHLFVTTAFLVANFWNFWINRRWTFHSHAHASWYREYPPFLAVGALGQVVNLGLVTALIGSGSPVGLPDGLLDDSSGLRTKLYWAQLIAIAIVMPLSFVVNKLWTFSTVRRRSPPAIGGWLDEVSSTGCGRNEKPDIPAINRSPTEEADSDGALNRPPSAS